MRLDVFHHDVLEQILLDPARLRPTGAELRRDIAAAVNDGGVAAALAAILDAEIVTAVRGWSIGHLILPAEVRSAH
jgi:hypothetical protein